MSKNNNLQRNDSVGEAIFNMIEKITSFGITILPNSSIFLVTPVDFKNFTPLLILLWITSNYLYFIIFFLIKQLNKI